MRGSHTFFPPISKFPLHVSVFGVEMRGIEVRGVEVRGVEVVY